MSQNIAEMTMDNLYNEIAFLNEKADLGGCTRSISYRLWAVQQEIQKRQDAVTEFRERIHG